MKIAIDLNDVLREFYDKFHQMYCVIHDISEDDFPAPELKTINLLEYYGVEANEKFGRFKNTDELYNFMYVEVPMELHANSERITKTLWGQMQLFYPEITDMGHKLYITSREFGQSVQASYSFLSRGCPIDKVIFEKATDDLWQHFDAIITANPILMACKPEDKIAIKINRSYNGDSKADLEYNSILDIFGDPDGFNDKLEEISE